MADLDDVASYAAVDPADALADVEGTPAQWEEARRLADVRLDLSGVTAVLVTGMGGSGISGDVTVARTVEIAVPQSTSWKAIQASARSARTAAAT